MYQIGFFLLAVLAGVLPFAAPGPCTQALREGLVLCGGPLLLSLFPFLVVSSLLVQCPASDLLAVPFRPLARGIGVHSPCAARVLMIGFFGGFAPAANAAAQAVRTGQLTAREADALLPACVCSWPSFVVLTVGESMLGSAELGVLLFGAQLAAGYLTAALLCRMASAGEGMQTISGAAAPDGCSHRRSARLCKALRLRTLFPDAGSRGRGAPPAHGRNALRHAAGSLFRV